MARPLKEGLTYFPLDVEMDEKVEMIESEHGLVGFALYIKLLQEAYKKFDGRIPINTDGLFSVWKILRKRTGIDAETLTVIINDMVEAGLFDRGEYDSGYLTSSGIQKRIKEVNKRRKKDRVVYKKTSKSFPQRKPHGNPEETGERKEKEIKENILAPPGVHILNPTKEPSPVNTLKAYFSEKFKERTQSEYACNHGKDGKLLKTLLESQTPERIRAVIDLYFSSRDDFIINQAGYSIGVFSAVYNKLVSKAAPKQNHTGQLTDLQKYAIQQEAV